MDKPIYLGFARLKLSKLHMYETYYDKLQPYFSQDEVQLPYMDCDSFVLTMRTEKIINDLKKFEDMFDFCNLDENHVLFSKKIENLLVNSKYKLLKTFI